MKMLDIEVLPIKNLYNVLQHSNTTNKCAIIMSSYDINEEKLNGIQNIYLQFDDIKDKNKNSFNENMAQQIHKFIDKNANYEKIYICCDSGESRSSAIAAATYKYLGTSDKIIWKNYHYHPNELVYKIMCNEYRYTSFFYSIKIQNFYK